MAYPTCADITAAAERLSALSFELGSLATLVCTDPEGDHHAAIYEAKAETLKQCALAVRDMRIDVAAYPFGADSIIIYGEES